MKKLIILKSESAKKFKDYILLFLCPILAFYLLEFFTHNPFTSMKFPIQLLNIFFFECLMALLLFLFGSLRIALMTETVICFVVGLANYFVIQFRAAPIMPWDIFSIGTAASVADNYTYTLNKTSYIVLFLFALLLFIEFHCNMKLSKNWKVRISGCLLFFALLAAFTSMLHKDSSIQRFRLYDKLFTPTVMSKRDGTAVAFLMELKYVAVAKPAGYDVSKVAEELNTYVSDKKADKKPNIIVIMDEAFSDLNVLGDFPTNSDYMPFTHSLLAGADDTISGYLNVSVLGGNTANTEFEFLTGNSMAFLPQGSIPYQQYIKHQIFALPSYLETFGYQTVAMHPYYASGWDRDTVYPLFGFQSSYFIDDYADASYVRNYVSDQSSFDYVKKVYEQKKEGQPLFVFHVTMQNHSSYTDAYSNFDPSITVDGVDSASLTNYLSLLKLSDDALSNLIDYFKTQNEDTIIVLFGDHQPTNSVVEPIWKLQGKTGDTLTESEEALRYKVPFIIWANYDIEEESGIETSANYLGARLLDTAKLPLSPYHSFLEQLETSFPVVSAFRVEDSTGKSTPVKEQTDALNEYQQLQYYELFDSDGK